MDEDPLDRQPEHVGHAFEDPCLRVKPSRNLAHGARPDLCRLGDVDLPEPLLFKPVPDRESPRARSVLI